MDSPSSAPRRTSSGGSAAIASVGRDLLSAITRPEPDVELPKRVTRMVDLVSEALVTGVNEPSTGLYYVKEHIKKSVPTIAKHKDSIRGSAERLGEAALDVQMSREALQEYQRGSAPVLASTYKKLASLNFLLQQHVAPASSGKGRGTAKFPGWGTNPE
eukprot:tig00020710_g13347.t1